MECCFVYVQTSWLCSNQCEQTGGQTVETSKFTRAVRASSLLARLYLCIIQVNVHCVLLSWTGYVWLHPLLCNNNMMQNRIATVPMNPI